MQFPSVIFELQQNPWPLLLEGRRQFQARSFGEEMGVSRLKVNIFSNRHKEEEGQGHTMSDYVVLHGFSHFRKDPKERDWRSRSYLNDK